MFRTDGDWHVFSSEQTMELFRKESGVRVFKGKWYGPGWYFAAEYSQRCPRGCCWDDVIEVIYAPHRAIEIQEQMKGLAESLKRVRHLAKAGA